ncbi:PhoU domain-containing protein [Desulfovibrio inopinatus]|uniref:PhoU domain-containing protein n=1 Tax=Desulfovibrio inopinatus TaxID=102109 RepID=UPI000426209C|nr:PhoU domain-containing protein [Desulfovibrio inopinatus]
MNIIVDNFKFMLMEVGRQLESLRRVMKSPDEKAILRMDTRDDYIDNLKSVLQNNCYAKIHGDASLGSMKVSFLRGINTITTNLERIGDHCVNISRQLLHYEDTTFLQHYDYEICLDVVASALERVDSAVFKRDMNKAFEICRTEMELDSIYKVNFDRIRRELRSGDHTGDFLTTLFIFRYFERIGDTLLNIGEAVIFTITGDRFKIHQIDGLRDVLAQTGKDVPLTDVEFKSIWGSRSGCRIGKVEDASDGNGAVTDVIFKDGEREKLVEERDTIARWQEIAPGLAPRVIALREHDESTSMLVEFLKGETFQDIVLGATAEHLAKAMATLKVTVEHLWDITRKDKPVDAHVLGQLQARLGGVFRTHPHYNYPQYCIGGYVEPSLASIVEAAKEKSHGLVAPFSVFIHGDFNSNNIIYNDTEDRIHYIDLHRSADNDYVQDVSVFMVSNFRLPLFRQNQRSRLRAAALEMYNFGHQYAQKHGDTTYEARMCLGLARSLMTSTRFELNSKFAKHMFMRGVFYLKTFLAHQGDFDAFNLPLEGILD